MGLQWDDNIDDEIEEEDDDYDIGFDCGMSPDGRCTKAGSEECDWECPYSYELDQL